MALRPHTHVLGLCAGVGGLELGIMLGERLRGRDARGVCYVEREAAAAASLVASMDAGWLHPAPVWSDLATFDGRPWRGRIHCVASGDPCQGNSVAGNGLGADDPRFLISHVLRIVDACRPHRLFRENVTGNAAGQLAALVGPLEDMGYRVAAGIFSSGRTGNSHGRERLIVMADAEGCDGDLRSGCAARSAGHHADVAGLGRAMAVADAHGTRCAPPRSGPAFEATRQPEPGCSHVADAAGGRCDPGFEEPAGEIVYLSGPGGSPLAGNGSRDVADADGRRCGREGFARHAPIDVGQPGAFVPPAIIPGPDDRRWRDVLDHWPQLAPALSKEEAQSLLCGGLDAVAYRIESLRAIGNGVDPVVGATAWLRLGALLDADRAERAGAAAVRTAA